jgi:hypothetical protein
VEWVVNASDGMPEATGLNLNPPTEFRVFHAISLAKVCLRGPSFERVASISNDCIILA